MAAILYSPSVQIGDAYAPSLNGAFAQVFAESGIKPVVKPPYGGNRTAAQEQAVNPGGPKNSDHVKQRAVDIDNQGQLRAWNNARFVAIMAAHGWRCVTVDGDDYTKWEPWHFANQSSTPAGDAGTPIDNDPTVPWKEHDMRTIFMDSIKAEFTVTPGNLRSLPVELKDGKPWAQYAFLSTGYTGQQDSTNFETFGADVLDDNNFSRTIYIFGLENYSNAKGIAAIQKAIKSNPSVGHVFRSTDVVAG